MDRKREKIIRIQKGVDAVTLPEEFLRHLELIPGAEVEVRLDRKKNRVIVRALHGEDFIAHFKDSMETMA